MRETDAVVLERLRRGYRRRPGRNKGQTGLFAPGVAVWRNRATFGEYPRPGERGTCQGDPYRNPRNTAWFVQVLWDDGKEETVNTRRLLLEGPADGNP
jgi:hypothetical protein